MTQDPRTFDDGDYTRLDSTQLIALTHIYLLFPLRTAAHYLRAATIDFDDGDRSQIESIWNQSGEFALNVTEQNMRHLFLVSGGNEKVIDYFLDWKNRRMTVERILNGRLRELPFSNELMAFEDKDMAFDRIEPIAKVILGSRVSYENWQDQTDVSLQAVDTAVAIHEQISGQYSITKPAGGLPALPMDLEIPVDDPPPFHMLFRLWFWGRVTETLKRWGPVFDGILETEAVNRARIKAESMSRAARRRSKEHQPFNKIEEGGISRDHPLFNNPFPPPDEPALRQDNDEAVRRAIDNVARKHPRANVKKYFDKLKSDENITKKEAALTIGRDPSMGRHYQRELESELVREGILSEHLKKPTKKRPGKKS